MKILVLFVCLWSSLSYGGSVYVGNGGEGIRVADQVFLRDLYEVNLHTQSYLGIEVDDGILMRLASVDLDGLPIDRMKLARKLTDLNELSPNLGYYVIAALSFYRWVLTDVPLTPLPPTTPSPLVPQGERVNVANRYQGNVWIQRSHWKQMSAENRIALLIHEALFSFLRPQCIMSTCLPNDPLLREIVALAFSYDVGKRKLTPHMEKSLRYPSVEARRNSDHSVSMITVNFKGKKFLMDLEGASDLWVESFTTQVCHYVSSASPKEMYLELRRPPFKLVDNEIPMKIQNIVYLQRLLQFEIKAGKVNHCVSAQNMSKYSASFVDCYGRLSEVFFNWRNYFDLGLRRDGTTSVDKLNLCLK